MDKFSFSFKRNQFEESKIYVVYQFISIFKINLNTVCHKFGKSAISQDLDLSDLLWKLNQVNSSTVKWPILFLAILSFCILSIPVLYFKMTKLIFNCGLLLKLRSPNLCLSVRRYAQLITKGTNEYSFNFAKSRRCSTNISIPFVREFIHLFYVIQVSTVKTNVR